MKLTWFCFGVLMLMAGVVEAADKDYTICAIAGFHEGNKNRFLTDLAERVAAKNNLFGDENCTQALKAGRDAGERFSKPGIARSEMDYLIIRQATNFSNMIYDAILSRVKF